MPITGTTGTNRVSGDQAFDITVLEMKRPNAVTATGSTASSGAVTLNQGSGRITTDGISTAASGIYAMTLNNTVIDPSGLAQVFASVHNGSNSTGTPMIAAITPGNANAVIQVKNTHGSAAFTGSLVIDFIVVRKGPQPL